MSRKSKIIIFLVFLLVIAISLWFFLLYLVKNQARTIAERENRIEQLQDQETDLVALENLVESTAADRRLLAEYFYAEDDIINLIELIERVAAETGTTVDISNIDPGDDLLITLRSTGSATAVRNFITRLETGPFISSFGKVTLQKNIEADEVVSWTANLILKILSFEPSS
ncbi:MAG: hypothetical protein WDZ85_04095 [Candidatus Paceibacterota bacterium]